MLDSEDQRHRVVGLDPRLRPVLVPALLRLPESGSRELPRTPTRAEWHTQTDHIVERSSWESPEAGIAPQSYCRREWQRDIFVLTAYPKRRNTRPLVDNSRQPAAGTLESTSGQPSRRSNGIQRLRLCGASGRRRSVSFGLKCAVVVATHPQKTIVLLFPSPAMISAPDVNIAGVRVDDPVDSSDAHRYEF